MGSAQGWVYRIFTIQDHPADPDLYLRRARLRREAGRLDEAVEDYRKAAELSQNPSTAIEELARTLLQDGDRARALIELEGSVKKYGADTTGFLRLGKERWMLDDKTSARAIWELGVTLFRENTVLLRNIALARYHAGDYEGASQDYRRAMAGKTELLGIRTDLAWALLKLERFAEVRELCEAVLQIRPEDPAAKAILARIKDGAADQ